jgi:hypothetical protein
VAHKSFTVLKSFGKALRREKFTIYDNNIWKLKFDAFFYIMQAHCIVEYKLVKSVPISSIRLEFGLSHVQSSNEGHVGVLVECKCF